MIECYEQISIKTSMKNTTTLHFVQQHLTTYKYNRVEQKTELLANISKVPDTT